MSLILELGVVAAFNLANTPYEKKDTQLPYLYVEKSITDNTYFSILNSSRTNATKLDRANPKTALWTVSGGYKFKVDNQVFNFELGHQSEHNVDSKDEFTESYNFVKLSYRVEY